ncbi:hypothetical protein MRX96_005876 [Rhipicephalus microplus]
MGTCRFISVCEEWACRNYMSAIELSLNGSQDPCNNFHRFVCHGWKHRQQLLSVVDVAEDAMYGRALSALAWSDNEGSSHQDSSVPPTLSVKNKIAGFVKSCIELARSSLLRSQIFMAKRHLPWPKPSRWDPSLKFSLTSQHHLFRLDSHHASVRRTAGSDIVATLRYRHYVRAMIRFFNIDVADNEVFAKIEAIDQFTLQVLFFVASCYALCSSGNHNDIIYGDASHRCNNPVKALPEFSAAFQCESPE